MAINTELKKIYSNYDDTRMFYDTVSLFHPNFDVVNTTVYPSETKYPSETLYPGLSETTVSTYPSETKYPSTTLYPSDINYNAQSFFLIRDIVNHNLQREDGRIQTFTAYPFNIIQPQVGEDQQDIGIILDNVSLEIIENIELAAQNTSAPIVMTFSVYMDGDTASQITPISLALTEIVVDMFTVSCKASRVDLFKRKLPFGKNTYYYSNFKGLTI